MREDLHAPGRRPILAGLLPGVQGEVPAGGRPYPKVPEMREGFHFSVKRPALAEVLPGMSGKAYQAIRLTLWENCLMKIKTGR